MRHENLPPSPSPERPPLAPYDPPDPAPQAAAWRLALKVVLRQAPGDIAALASSRLPPRWNGVLECASTRPSAAT